MSLLPGDVMADLSQLLPRVISIAFGLALIGFLWWLGLRRLNSIRRAEITDAIVIEMLPVQSTLHLGRVSHVPKLKILAHDGTELVVTRVHSSARLLRPEFRVGQRVRVAFDPQNRSAEILKPAYTIRLLGSLIILTLAILSILCVLVID